MLVNKLSLLVAAIGATQVSAFFRMQCYSRLVLDQVDPIVQPGVVPSKHLHSIMGGSNFAPDATGDSLLNPDCTSCRVKGDGSIYWVPSLFFQDGATGKLELVTQMNDMLVYYLPERGSSGPRAGPFKTGFRMVAGDPTLRNNSLGDVATEDSRRQQAIGYNCLNYNAAPEGFAQVKGLPDKATMDTCIDGLRADIAFPNCWNGELDSADHKSHVAYPTDTLDGDCPSTHPTRIISILYETLWRVVDFAGRDGSFVWSNGDPTGYGYHGDFMSGWDTALLQRVVDDVSCTTATATGGEIESCNTFANENRLQSNDEMSACTIKPRVSTDFTVPMEALPGCNKIEKGPEPATGCEENTEDAVSSSPAKAAAASVYSKSPHSESPYSKPTYAEPAVVPSFSAVQGPDHIAIQPQSSYSTPAVYTPTTMQYKTYAVPPKAKPTYTQGTSDSCTSTPTPAPQLIHEAPGPGSEEATPYIVWVTDYVTDYTTVTDYAAKRSAIPEMRPRHRHAHRRRSNEAAF